MPDADLIVAADTEEAAALLHLTPDGVRDRIQRGKLQADRHPTTGRYTQIVIPRAAIEAREAEVQEAAREAGDALPAVQAALQAAELRAATLEAQLDAQAQVAAALREQVDTLRQVLQNEQAIRMQEQQHLRALDDQRAGRPRERGFWTRLFRGD